MEAALIDISSAASSSLSMMSPSRRKRGTTVANMGARRLPAGVRVSIQQMVEQAMRWGPNLAALGVGGLATLILAASRKAARASSRCHPVCRPQRRSGGSQMR